MSEEPAKAPRRRRVSRAAQPLPVHATVHLKGHKAPLVIDCFRADQQAGFWVFVKPSEIPGMTRMVHISLEQVVYVEVDRWPEQPPRFDRPQLFETPNHWVGPTSPLTATFSNTGTGGPVIHNPRAPRQTLQSVEAEQRPLRSKMVDGVPFSEAVDEHGNMGIFPAGFMPT